MYTINYLNNNFNHKKIEMYKYSNINSVMDGKNKDITKTNTKEAAEDAQKYTQQLFDENDDLNDIDKIETLSAKVATGGGGDNSKYYKIEVE